VRGIVQHCRVGKAGAEHEESTDQQRANASDKTIVRGKGNRRRVLETAMTTSVQALGKSLPRSGKMPSSVGRSPGSQRPACYRLRVALTFPGFGITKSGRFVEIEASTPSARDATQWLFRPVLRTWPAGTIAPVPSPSFRADERPSPLYSRGVGRDCSALNGSTASHSHLLPDPFPDPGTIQ